MIVCVCVYVCVIVVVVVVCARVSNTPTSFHTTLSDELAEAWRVMTPVLKELDDKRIVPIPYTYGSRAFAEADALIKRYGYVYSPSHWQDPRAKI
jgi:glucose-6-phosphate 1-dehydrogenase